MNRHRQAKDREDPLRNRPTRLRRSLLAVIPACLIGAAVVGSFTIPSGSPETGERSENTKRLESPRTLNDLLAMSPSELSVADLALVNLLCAKGLPGTHDIDMAAITSRLNDWAQHVRAETERHLYRLSDPRYAKHYNYSEARLRAEFIVQVLQEDCGVHYNADRIFAVDFSNPADLFIHGLVDNDNGGTCASMPVLYAAVGRRLGYPIKLVLAKQHIFCRWDADGERFNIEAAGNGGVSYPPDAHYRSWPQPISDDEVQSGEFLRSLTPEEELATFLLNRGICRHANGQVSESRTSLEQAHRLWPQALTIHAALSLVAPHQNVRASRNEQTESSREGSLPQGDG